VLFESLEVAKLAALTEDGAGGGLVPQSVMVNDDRSRVLATENPPWCWVCSLLITTGDGRLCLGSGWVVGPRTVITAGHCLHTRRGGWVRRVEVLVGRNEGTRLSAHVSSDLHSVRGWTEAKDWGYDYGAILLSDPVRPEGGLRFKVLSDKELDTLRYAHVAGYPVDRTPQGTLWGSGRALAGVRTQALLYQLSTFGGQSGGPVFYKQGPERFAVGIHTYGGPQANYATRITADVYTNIKEWMRMSNDPA
jgi:V8-like Glu-specific endopeptidase